MFPTIFYFINNIGQAKEVLYHADSDALAPSRARNRGIGFAFLLSVPPEYMGHWQAVLWDKLLKISRQKSFKKEKLGPPLKVQTYFPLPVVNCEYFYV